MPFLMVCTGSSHLGGFLMHVRILTFIFFVVAISEVLVDIRVFLWLVFFSDFHGLKLTLRAGL